MTVTVLETDSFSDVYSVIERHKRKIPTRILRYCKEQMYELVRSGNPEEKLAVVDFDALDSTEAVEFVVGVGVAKEYADHEGKLEEAAAEALHKNGYIGISPNDLFSDLISDKSRYDAKTLLTVAFPVFSKKNTFVPVYRYLRASGVGDAKTLAASDFDAAKAIISKMKSSGYRFSGYRNTYELNYKSMITREIVDAAGIEKAPLFIAHQKFENIDKSVLKNFISENMDFNFRDPYRSAFKKIICIYDYLEYGFDT